MALAAADMEEEDEEEEEDAALVATDAMVDSRVCICICTLRNKIMMMRGPCDRSYHYTITYYYEYCSRNATVWLCKDQRTHGPPPQLVVTRIVTDKTSETCYKQNASR